MRYFMRASFDRKQNEKGLSLEISLAQKASTRSLRDDQLFKYNLTEFYRKERAGIRPVERDQRGDKSTQQEDARPERVGGVLQNQPQTFDRAIERKGWRQMNQKKLTCNGMRTPECP
jgi:hypothetical protein